MQKRHYTKLATLALVFSLSACSALHTGVEKADLSVQTALSESIFVEPLAPAKRTLFLSVKNTSGLNLSLKPAIEQRLASQGLRLVDNPEQAHYMLLANVLRLSKVDQNGQETVLDGALSGGVVGGAVSSENDQLKGAVLGAVVGIVGNALVDDTLFTLVTDVQVRERPDRGAEWQTHQARVVSTAEQVNLKIERALPSLEQGLVDALAGIFAE